MQCQREYEGKGAYPNYVMDGIINGFDENARKVGLKHLLGHPQIRGVYSWSRGGGWYGPYIKDELWCDLNAYVLAQFVRNYSYRPRAGEGQGVRVPEDPSRTEKSIFHDYARQRLGLDEADAGRFRRLCLLSARAVLKGCYCEAFDRVLQESVLPAAAWMRDDRLGGSEQLAHVLEYLVANGLEGQALAEKAESVRLWEEIAVLAREIRWPAEEREKIVVSVDYGRLLFVIVQAGWQIMLAGYRNERSASPRPGFGAGTAAPRNRRVDPGQTFKGHGDFLELGTAIARYDALWREYRELARSPWCASLYEGGYFHLPGAPAVTGLDQTVDRYRHFSGLAVMRGEPA